MRAMVGAKSDADLVRLALWNFADHLDLDLPNTVFDLRPHLRPPNSGSTAKPVASRTNVAAVKRGRAQAKTHPWAIQNQTSWEERAAQEEETP
jgi:hypothetical protein